jgi:hypothetical protein
MSRTSSRAAAHFRNRSLGDCGRRLFRFILCLQKRSFLRVELRRDRIA